MAPNPKFEELAQIFTQLAVTTRDSDVDRLEELAARVFAELALESYGTGGLHATTHLIGGADEIGPLPTTDQKGALAGTNGVPSGTNKYVTDSDPRLGGGTLPGLTLVKATVGALGNGVADDKVVISAYIAAAAPTAANPLHLYFEPGRYRFDSSYVFPKYVWLSFAKGARLLPWSGVTIGIRGGLDPIPQWMFEFGGDGTGLIEFTESAAPSGTLDRAAFLTEAYVEWMGAIGNRTVDDTIPLRKFVHALRGYPLLVDETSSPAWARCSWRPLPGAVYATTEPIRLKNGIGSSIQGGGLENAIILYRDTLAQGYTVTGVTGKTFTLAAGHGLTSADIVDRWIVLTGPSMSGDCTGKHYRVVSLTVNDVLVETDDNFATLAAAGFVWPGVDQTCSFLHDSVIELGGVFDPQLDAFTIEIENGSEVMTGVYGHRRSTQTLRHFSRAVLTRIRVTGKWVRAAFHMGSYHQNQLTWQEDNSRMFACIADGQEWALSALEKLIYYQYGMVYGTGVHGNNLLHTAEGCMASACRRGVGCFATGLTWIGGTVDNSPESAFYLSNGMTHFKVIGMRVESSGRFIDGQSPYGQYFAASFENIQFVCNKLKKGPEGTYDAIRLNQTAGTWTFKDFRCDTMPSWGGFNPLQPYSTLGNDGTNDYVEIIGAPAFTLDWAGEMVEIGQVFSFNRYKVLSTTEPVSGTLRITVNGTWATARQDGIGPTPAAPGTPNWGIRLVRIPRIRLVQAQARTHVHIDGFGGAGQSFDDTWIATGSASVWYNGLMQSGLGANIDAASTDAQGRISGPIRIIANKFPASNQNQYVLFWDHERTDMELTVNHTQDLGGGFYPDGTTPLPYPMKEQTTLLFLKQDGVGGRSMTLTAQKQIKNAVSGTSALSHVLAGGAAGTSELWEMEYDGTVFRIRRLAQYPA